MTARYSRSSLNKSMDTLFPQPDSSKCRVCDEPVVDGRWNYCSKRCSRIAKAVQRMFVWDHVREKVLERDGHTCQECGVSKARQEAAYRIALERSKARNGGVPDFDEVPESPHSGFFHVDHITRLEDGGHPFDSSNLQTLCKNCHREKTAEENSRAGGERPEIGLEEFLE